MTKKRKRPPPAHVVVLFDEDGEIFDAFYETRDAAHNDAVGPRFRGGHTVRVYKLLLRREEVKLRHA